MYDFDLENAGGNFNTVVRLLKCDFLDILQSTPQLIINDKSLDENIVISCKLGLAEWHKKELRLTAAGDILTTKHPFSLRNHFLFIDNILRPCYALDRERLEVPCDTFFKHYGKSYFDWLDQHSEERQLAHAAMFATQHTLEIEIAERFPFCDYRKIVDIGGGAGGLACAIKNKYPKTVMVVADKDRQAYDVEFATEKTGVDFQQIDFFEFVPAGADLYILKLVIHDWRTSEVEHLLRNIKHVIGKGALLIIESLMDAGNDDNIAALWDYHMMLTIDGKERSLAEIDQLGKQAGLMVVDVVSGPPPLAMILLRVADEENI